MPYFYQVLIYKKSLADKHCSTEESKHLCLRPYYVVENEAALGYSASHM
jgi:hypothetical protein